MNVKYAYLVFNLPFPFPELTTAFDFDGSTQIQRGSIKEQITGPDAKHWPEWVGSLTWERLCQNNLILSSWMKTTNSDSDGENQSLKRKISNIFRVLPLVGPLSPPSDEVFRISGNGKFESQLSAVDIRTFTEVPPWICSYYNHRYWNDFEKWGRSAFPLQTVTSSWK